MNILVLDDNESVADSIAEALDRELDAYCTVEGSYSSAVDATLNQVYDVVIADIDLKNGKTGVDFIKYYKQHNPTIKTIVYTGLDPESHQDIYTQLTTLQIDAFTRKPILIADIVKTVKRVYNMHDTKQISFLNELSEKVTDMRVKIERHDAELCSLKETLTEIKSNIGLLFKKSDSIKLIMTLIGLVMAALQIVNILKG